ncbi:MAG TPA: hypothetical protein VGJ00_07815 [Rhabdochlamydiaceae bacterium]
MRTAFYALDDNPATKIYIVTESSGCSGALIPTPAGAGPFSRSFAERALYY